MGQRERNDDGRYAETVTPERVLDALVATADPVATTSDVADRLDCTSEGARVKLVGLAEEGRVDRRTVGSSAVVWWPADATSRARRAPVDAAGATDDRTAVEERDAAAVLDTLDAFIEEGDAPEPPFPSAEAVGDDSHARRHRERLERLANDGGDE